jgi:protein tyrosine/serine phosphatase
MRRTLVSCVLATSLALSASASPDAAGIARPGIDNFGEVSPTYFRGAQPEGNDYAALAKFGIKTVVDLQADGEVSEQHLVENAGMQFMRIPMTTRTAPTAEQIASFLKLVNDPANQPVYVHCAGGRHRTGVMTAIYRITHDSWTSEKAFKEMKQYKFGADFLHPEFKRFVYAYRTEPAGPASAPGGLIATTAIAQ